MSQLSAFSYARFSTVEQLKGDSLRRQTMKAELYANAHGLRLDTKLTFQDLGTSAFRGRNVETGKLGDFLEAVEKGLVPKGSYLLVENLDRISRQAARKALRVLENILERGITLVTLDDNRVYTEKSLDEDPMALLIALLTFIRANEESTRKSERLKAAWAGKRQRVYERILTARAPAWLRAEGAFHVIEDRAVVVRRIFDLIAQGAGLESIARKLNEERIPVFGTAKFWHRSYIGKIADNPAVVGTLVPHALDYVKDRATGRQKRMRRALEPISDYYPVVVDLELYQRVRAMRGKRMPATRISGIKNLLAGLAVCASCEGSMTRVSKGKRSRAYLVCARAKAGAGCKYSAVPQEILEARLRAALPDMPIMAPESQVSATVSIELLSRELLAIQGAIPGLASAVARTNSADLVRKLGDRERRRTELQVQIADLKEQTKPLPISGKDQLARAANLEPTALNALLRQLFKRVEISYSDGAGAMFPVWKDGRKGCIFLN